MTTSPARRAEASTTVAFRLATPGAALFFIGLSSVVTFDLVGTLFVTDLLIVASLPFLLFRRGAPALLRAGAPILLLAAFWLVGAMLTDIVRDTSFEDYARGWAKISFLGATFTVVLLLSELRIRRLMAYFAGLAVAGMVSTRFFPNSYQLGLPWKFGYALPVAILAVIIASLGSRPRLGRQSLPPLLVAMINFVLNYRSMFAILVATSAVSAIAYLARLFVPTRRLMSPAFAISFLLLSGIGMWAGSAFYGHFAGSGVLGIEAKEKYDLQSQGGLGLLLGGRSEALVSTRAIADSPILGHGSWAKDPHYVALQVLLLRQRGVMTQGNPFQSAYIPSHSYFLGSWVEAGIAGGLFWAICWVVTLRALMLQLDIRSAATPFAAFMLVQLLWNIPFSPFGADVRFYVAGELCVVLWASKMSRSAARQQSPPAVSPMRGSAHV